MTSSKNSGTKSGRPPGSKPFKKGQSGNAAGRPAGTPNVRTTLCKLLEIASTKNPDINRLEAICAKPVVMAEEGDLASIDGVFDNAKPISRPTSAYAI